ncbi:MAG: alanine--tRNA ligase [Alphaproteobacteria bacterium]
MNKPKEISIEIRESFVNFFKKNSHTEVPSSPLIPEDDPSLLFTNSGMVQFKNFFTGKKKPIDKNIVTIQKCIRAGGKHNDLENVGFTPRHHTFFEMLGNFSFGGYFKENAILMAWEYLTKELCIDKKKLFITIFNDDDESEVLWKKISGFDRNKIIKINSNDNFWSMGEEGPCGPCSEIFFDNGKKYNGGLPGSAEQDGERYVEIWNLVFMEYERTQGKLKKLRTKCVDTGMGLERITALISETADNYDTDLFQFLFKKIEEKCNLKRKSNNLVSFKIIADHLKSICMLMSEGILPSNEGRGYVLRRLIRRSLMQVNKIHSNGAFLNDLVKTTVDKYSKFYFELNERISFIEKNLKIEEEKFMETIDIGLSLLNKEIKNLESNEFSPEIAFKLYDTYGFPIDVTRNILTEKKIKLDVKKYEEIVLQNKSKQKNTWVGSQGKSEDKVFLDLIKKSKETTFLGYEKTESESKLLYILHKSKIVTHVEKEEKDIILIFDKTPFYAEGGGQVGDTGNLYTSEKKLVGKITDTKKLDGNIFLHYLKNNKEDLNANQELFLSVDTERREKIRNNHSATHLLHASLRTILGDHISQKGSLVNDEKLRFDFTYNEQLTNAQVNKIESLVNQSIRENIESRIEFMPTKQAIKSGAIALFGERYPENVRVISFTNEDRNSSLSSVELCGGTHVKSTGQIGTFKIVSDHSVSSGVKRIEAITGESAEVFFSKQIDLLIQIKESLKANENNLLEKIETLKKEVALLKKNKTGNDLKFSENNIISLKKYKCYFDTLEIDQKELKNLSDLIKKNLKASIIILVTKNGEKISVVVSVSKELSDEVNAIDILQKIVIFLGGKGGGGRKDMAQGGAPFSNKIEKLKDFLEGSVLVF